MFRFFISLLFGILFELINVFPASCQEFQFQQEIKSIPFVINGVTILSPFTGGCTNSKPTFADIDNDHDFDLFIGSSNGQIRFYRNIGNPDNPIFQLETLSFDSINVGSQSSPTFVDIDNDDDLDLFFGTGNLPPFEKNREGMLVFYRNIGTSTYNKYVLEVKNYLNIQLESSCTPTFADIDDDNDMDLFLGSKSGIHFYRNTGTVYEPSWNLESTHFASIDDGLAPIFSDIDKDGDLDLITGTESGYVYFYENTGTTANASFSFNTAKFPSIDVGWHSAPTLIDINNDSRLDLFIGEYDGNVNFYQNTGVESSPLFILKTANIDSNNVIRIAKPTFIDIDHDGDSDLFVGEDEGHLFFYRNKGSSSNPLFILENMAFDSIDVGSSSAPAFVDIDNDNDFDLFVGNLMGCIYFFLNNGTSKDPRFMQESTNFDSIDVGHLSMPVFADIDNDKDFDLFIGEYDGNINFYRNIGTVTQPYFSLVTENFAEINVGQYYGANSPVFIDFDYDNDLDLFVGEALGNINFYRNNGSAKNPIFELESECFGYINKGENIAAYPALIDIDNDFDVDVFVGTNKGNIYFYSNVGSYNNISFSHQTSNIVSIDFGWHSTPSFCDIDKDGDVDLFVGEEDGNITYFRNIGTPTNPIFSFETSNFIAINAGRASAPTFIDIDNDGDFDLFVGDRMGDVNYYKNEGTATDADFFLEKESLISLFKSGETNRIKPAFIDVNKDGLSDVFLGHAGNLWISLNEGTINKPYFSTYYNLNWRSVWGYPAPAFVDIDNDQDLDLFIGGTGGGLTFYRNNVNVGIWGFSFEMTAYLSYNERLFSTPAFADIDDDGDFDLLMGEQYGGLHFYRNITPVIERINVSTDIINFGDVPIDSQCINSLKISNISHTYLVINEIILSNSLVDFEILSPKSFPISIAPDSIPLSVILSFFPKSKGVKIDTMNIKSNDPKNQNVIVKLIGKGIETVSSKNYTRNLPDAYSLSQNFPNPFNSSTQIICAVPKNNFVSLIIYNINGQIVETVVNEYKNAGYYKYRWDAKEQPSGIYFYQFIVGEFSQIKKMLIIK